MNCTYSLKNGNLTWVTSHGERGSDHCAARSSVSVSFACHASQHSGCQVTAANRMITLTEALPPWLTDRGAPGRRRAIAEQVCHSLATGIKADMIGHAHRQGGEGRAGQGRAVWAVKRYFYRDFREHRWKIPDTTSLCVSFFHTLGKPWWGNGEANGTET